jgi:hypothetical protein
LQHKDSPFSEEEYSIIYRRFQRLMRLSGKLIYVMNGKFDLRVVGHYLKLPVINHDIWEVTAGEHDLDENIGLLDQKAFRGLEGVAIKTKFGNLRNLACLYGSDFYYTAPFSKEQRDTIAFINIMEHTGAQEYCAADAQITLGVGLKQGKT